MFRLQKLKKLMKANRRKDSDEEQRDSSEDVFRTALMSEIDKVDSFFAAREAEYWYNFFIKLYPRILEVCRCRLAPH
jgi:hypothetical protein